MGLTIGLDGTPLLGERSGVGYYTGRLLAAMLKVYPEGKFLLYSNRPLGALESDLAGAVPVAGYFPQSRWAWMQTVLPRVIAQSRPDLCHFTNSLAPLYLDRPFVLSVHDASLFLYSHYHPRARLLTMRLLLPMVARRAAAVITVSHSARQDLIRVLDLPAEKVHVIYEAAPAHFAPVNDQAELERLRRKYGLPEAFLLYVGTLEPRKNLSRLLQAFQRFRQQGFPHRLVMAGPWGWHMEGFGREIEALGLRDAIQFLGYIPTEDLPGLYSLTTLFVFPSLYEGFGLPPLEAMACGAPVLSSDNSSLAEICDGAAYLVDPRSVDSIAEGLRRVVADDALRADLRCRGLERAGEFSWDRAAQETLAVYQQVAGQKEPPGG
ncbi:MAG: glycosyltransferase family 4 protein [Chloroflexi bacterium]|nr:glycosyltransferase family 4 protein [Chloroflexota bacterium]MCI0576640.1 glycosyltransferase family 4 protein [Chloroflexota bacterium]MCI0646992.1 glycosyltransferase family 4 protein [Chloroflexota bacterium]MCI0730692.1 glycosyltransferase family 4 protein [Chloroflexota bacterium]